MVQHLFFKLENERDSELEACEYLDIFAKKCGFLPESIDEMRLAFIEGVINAKEHAPKGTPGGEEAQVHVALTFENDLLKIQIRDFGKGFDPTVVEKPDIRKKMKSSYKRGWGLMLMEKLMDGAEVTSFPPSGTLIQLVKKRVATNEVETVDTFQEHKRIERLKYILSSFIDLSSFLCQNNDLQSGLRSMLRILLGTLGVTRGAIYLFSDDFKNLDCLVDIKLKAYKRLPHVSVTADLIKKMSTCGDGDVTEVVKEELPDFTRTYKSKEMELIYTLQSDNQDLGILILGNRFRKNEEELLDKELLSTLSKNISSAINTFRLMEKLKNSNESLDRRIRELDAVREASQTISSELELENLPYTVESIFKTVMGITKFSMAIFDPTENRFNLRHSNRGLPTNLDLWTSPISQYVVQRMEPLFIEDLKCDSRFNYPRSKNYNSNSFIVIPIIVQNEVLGLINLTDKDGKTPLDDKDFELAKLLCSQLGIALKNANLYKRGITDSLTRLYTNHYFKMRLAQEISRSRRVRAPISIIMIGINKLDDLTKKYGQGFRDASITKIATAIKKLIRFNDLPCRFEGDKFAIILPDTAIEGARKAANKVLTELKDLTIKSKGFEEKASVSISVTEFQINSNINQFISRAEALLKAAQEKGDNCIES